MTDTDTETQRVDAAERVTSAFETSSVVALFRRALGQDSRVNAVGRWLWRSVERSFVFRWLTKEPETEVIVIDFRETYTVGPFVRLFDSLVDRATPYWQGSRLARALDRIECVFERAAETRVGRQLASPFVPPTSPKERDGDR